MQTSGNESPNIFMQEDEIPYWLHYPLLHDNSLQTYLSNNDLLYTTPPLSAPPYLPPPVGPPVLSSSIKVTLEVRPSPSNVTPPPQAHTSESRVSRVSDKPAPVSTSGAGAGTGAGRDIETCEMSVSVTSSPGSIGLGEGSGMEPSTEKASAEKSTPRIDGRKRKLRDTDGDDAEKDVEFGYHENKQSHGGSTSTKRQRSAEIHNLSERRRHDRINEKMKALQELIPRCNKTDKASMLDEAIEYLKSLQMQVNMMSMGCSMAPMMFLGVQPHMPPMGMCMGMGTNHAMFPYPVIPPGQPLPNSAVVAATAAAHLSPSFPAPGFNMTPIPVASPTPNLMNSLTLNSQNQPHVLGFADPFQRYHGPHQTQLPLPQNQGGMSPIAAKLSSSKDATNPDIITKPVE